MPKPEVLSTQTMQEILGCCYNTLNKIPIPRRPLYPGCRKYVYLMEDVLHYLRKQTDGGDVEPDFF